MQHSSKRYPEVELTVLVITNRLLPARNANSQVNQNQPLADIIVTIFPVYEYLEMNKIRLNRIYK